jgi:prepilin-type N-terminal cleavage/methylation domain-containing protein
MFARNKGFSLIELLVSVVLLSVVILTIIQLEALVRWSYAHQDNQPEERLASNILMMITSHVHKADGIIEVERHRLTLSLDEERIVWSSSGDRVVLKTETFVREWDLRGGLRFSFLQSGKDIVEVHAPGFRMNIISSLKGGVR